jgi:hypothetical protein
MATLPTTGPIDSLEPVLPRGVNEQAPTQDPHDEGRTDEDPGRDGQEDVIERDVLHPRQERYDRHVEEHDAQGVQARVDDVLLLMAIRQLTPHEDHRRARARSEQEHGNHELLVAAEE